MKTLEDIWEQGAESVRKHDRPPKMILVSEAERHSLMKQALNFSDPYEISNVREWPNRFMLFDILITTEDRETQRKARRRDTNGSYIHENDLPPLEELSFIDVCQSANKLVNIGTVLGRLPISRLIAAMPEIVCPCREYERQHKLTIVNADYSAADDLKVLTVEVQLKKFRMSIPQLHLFISGACGLCPNCQILYYVHF